MRGAVAARGAPARRDLPAALQQPRASFVPADRGRICLQAGWSIALDDELTHLTQQFTAGLVTALCLATGRPEATPRCIRIRPHRVAGIEHLRPWFGAALAPAANAVLEIDLGDDLLDAPLPAFGSASNAMLPEDWSALKGDLSCSQSVRLLLRSMASDPPTTVRRLARSGGISDRALQRLLTAEGTNVRQLIDEMRWEVTLEALPGGPSAPWRAISAIPRNRR